MKRFSLLFLFSIPLILFSQADTSSKGILWTTGLSWEQIKQKAKAENKYIFVDAYATWCVPCKKMDKEIYPNTNVGEIVNGNFIAVKVQMDTSKNDNENVKRWYADAYAIQKKYTISGFPAFIFLSPDGQLVHRSLGYKNADEFIDIVKYASDPQKQFYTLIEAYKAGKKNYDELPYMIKMAIDINENDWEKTLARDYIENILYKKKEKKLFTKENLYMIGEHLQSSNERGFKLLLKNQDKINALLGKKTYAQSRIDKVIYKEEVTPQLNQSDKTNTDPDWILIRNNITKKYSVDISNRVLLSGQLSWYKYKENWLELAKFNIEKIETYGLDTAGIAKTFTNNMIWEVFFLHCNDRAQLTKAIKWMEILLKTDPYDEANIDTYANLLYKTGLVTEAIKWETIATKLSPDDKDLQEALQCMKDREPTHVKLGAIWNANTLPIKIKKEDK